MNVAIRDLASYDESANQWVTEDGTYIFHIGASVADIKGAASIKIKKYTEVTNSVLLPQHDIKKLSKR